MQWLRAGSCVFATLLFGCTGDDGAVSDTDEASAGGGESSATPTSGVGDASGPESGPDSDGSTSGSAESGETGEPDGTTGSASECPHPLYADLDLCDLPGEGGAAACGPYAPPTLPNTTRTVTIESSGNQAALDALAACETPGTAVEIPNAAGRIGALTLGGVDDCDVLLGDEVIVDFLLFGQLPGPMRAPSHRVRVRGGKIASVSSAPESSDITLDGVTIDNGVMPSASRGGSGIVLHSDGDDSSVERFAVVNSVVRAVEGVPDEQGATHGIGYLGPRARNVLFANNNIVTAGNLNSWGFRVGGGCNVLIVDNTVRVSFHKLVRFNDADTDYVYIRGGTWMREFTADPFGNENNDAFKELAGDWRTDHIYIHDPVVYLLAPGPVAFGAFANPQNAGATWETRGIEWHALDPSVVSDEYLSQHEGYCTPGASCDYGLGSNTYAYDPALALPDDPWRALPTVPVSNPDMLPVEP